MLIQQDNFIQKLNRLDAPWKRMPDVTGKAIRDLKKQSDAELINHIRCGNRKAFDVLILRYEGKLKQLLYNRLFDKSLVDDVSQDVWELVIRLLSGKVYQEQGLFPELLRTIAFRKATKVNLRKKYNPEMSSFVLGLHDIEDMPLEIDLTDQVAEEAKKIIKTLKDREQCIIRMHHEEGMSFEAIAEKMNSPLNSVTKWHSRSMRRIKRELYKRGYKREIIWL